MEWLVAALTIVFGIVSIALWINYCSVGETERESTKGDIKTRGSTNTGEGDSCSSVNVGTNPGCAHKEDTGT
jgi:hypothetical protein